MTPEKLPNDLINRETTLNEFKAFQRSQNYYNKPEMTQNTRKYIIITLNTHRQRKRRLTDIQKQGNTDGRLINDRKTEK